MQSEVLISRDERSFASNRGATGGLNIHVFLSKALTSSRHVAMLSATTMGTTRRGSC